jgi:hypothetical protein
MINKNAAAGRGERERDGGIIKITNALREGGRARRVFIRMQLAVRVRACVCVCARARTRVFCFVFFLFTL